MRRCLAGLYKKDFPAVLSTIIVCPRALIESAEKADPNLELTCKAMMSLTRKENPRLLMEMNQGVIERALISIRKT